MEGRKAFERYGMAKDLAVLLLLADGQALARELGKGTPVDELVRKAKRGELELEGVDGRRRAREPAGVW